MDWLKRFLLNHTGQAEPDGRPLYAYQMNDSEYADLNIHFHQLILWDPQGSLATRFARIFCLYAAETFRRKHTEGSWTWEIAFRPLGMDAPPQPRISDWVRKGLDWWRRSLLYDTEGQPLFLLSIVREGGHVPASANSILLFEEGAEESQQTSDPPPHQAPRQPADHLPHRLSQDPTSRFSSTPWLEKFLFTHTRQNRPDGRPLYAYKTSDTAYADLKNLSHQAILLDRNGKLAPHLAPVFCLYAAETFRREHAEGPWAWETIFRPLGLETPSQQQIADWQRLLRGASGNRLFLMTIACEGGLPLRLLQRENTHLTQFFRTVLDSNYRIGQGGEKSAEAIARQQAHRLPRSLRQEPVFHLAATLIAKISELHSRIGEATDPIAALDQKAPDWRRDLPLRLDDQVAETLLKGLVRRLGELAREASARLRWRGRIGQTGAGWQVEKSLELPERPSGEQLAEWMGLSAADRPRWRLLLHTPAGTEAVAWLTRVQGEGNSARYHREWLRHGGVILAGAAVGQPHRLSLHDGQREYTLTVRDGEPWGDSPWIFIERGASGEGEWLTEGSARTRSERAWVLAAPELTARAVAGACECLGTIVELDRVVYRINGEIELFTSQQDRYRIACRAENEFEGTFVVVGDTVPQAALQQRPLYRGFPRIQAIDPEGRRQPATGRLQWRLLGDASPWREIHEPAHGRIWLRLADTNGLERCRRLVDLAPPNFQIAVDIGTGNQAGVVQLTGLAGAGIQLGPDSPAGVSINHAGDQARITCPSLPGVLPPPLTLLLNWPESQPITLGLPYPQRGAFFQLAGRSLPNDDWVPLDRLSGLRLFVQDPASGRHFCLDGALVARENQAVERFRQQLNDRLPPLEQGRLEISLFPWQDRIVSLLASSRDLDAQVRLAVETTQGERLAWLQVTRFDTLIEPDRAAGLVRIPENSLARLGPGWEMRVRLEMIPLWNPAEIPVALQACPNQPACWPIPPDLQPGPWWVVGRDGDWTRFRPLLWVVATDGSSDEPSDSTLAAAIRVPDAEQRDKALDALLSELDQHPDHADWPLLFNHLQLAREFPPSSLDVLRRLPAHPRTLALALFKADEQTFETVWSLSRQMPFLWVSLAVDDWREAATAYFGGLQTTLAEVDADGEIVFGLFQGFRERASACRTYWRPLCDWLQERLFPTRPLPKSSELSVARRFNPVVEQQIEPVERELMGRHDAEERWPQSDEIMGWMNRVDPWMKKYHYLHLDPCYRPVRCAPFVAAHLSLHGIAPTEQLIYELRLLRAFDRDWFDTIHAIALTLGLARRPPES